MSDAASGRKAEPKKKGKISQERTVMKYRHKTSPQDCQRQRKCHQAKSIPWMMQKAISLWLNKNNSAAKRSLSQMQWEVQWMRHDEKGVWPLLKKAEVIKMRRGKARPLKGQEIMGAVSFFLFFLNWRTLRAERKRLIEKLKIRNKGTMW